MTNEFEITVKRALAAASFGAPAANSCAILLFDSAVWSGATDAAACLLTTSEHDRAARFQFARERTTYVLAHACWRVALGSALGIQTQAVSLVMSPTGQPTLPGTRLATSLSHSGNWVAVAIANTCTVGVDIEVSPSRAALGPLVGSICTHDEKVELDELPIAAREAAMLGLWTRKEALLKAFGCGLHAEPSSVSARPGVSIWPPPSAPVRSPCIVRNLDLPAALVGALATPAERACAWQLYRLDPAEAIDTAFCKAYAASRSLRI
jgi:4'-phosphopantetheinyl transferase